MSSSSTWVTIIGIIATFCAAIVGAWLCAYWTVRMSFTRQHAPPKHPSAVTSFVKAIADFISVYWLLFVFMVILTCLLLRDLLNAEPLTRLSVVKLALDIAAIMVLPVAVLTRQSAIKAAADMLRVYNDSRALPPTSDPKQ